jgi:hypothetical protein
MKRPYTRSNAWATTLQRTDDPESPGHWLGDTALLRIDDPKVRLKARSLTQLAHTPADKVLAVHRYVQKMLLSRPFRSGTRDARSVLEAGQGDAEDKACLLVALLRAVHIPARIRYIELDGRILRGLTDSVKSAARPVVEVFVGNRWVKTDAFIFDPAYLKAALLALREERWNFGYGVHVLSSTSWDAKSDASVSGPLDMDNPVYIDDCGCYNDPREYAESARFRARHGITGLITRKLTLAVAARGIESGMQALRKRIASVSGRASQSPFDAARPNIPTRPSVRPSAP